MTAPPSAFGGSVPYVSRRKAYFVDKRPLTTWVSPEDFEKFHAIAHNHNVTAAAYLKAVITDVIVEEGSKIKTLFDKNSK